MPPPFLQEVYSHKAFNQKALEHAALGATSWLKDYNSHLDVTTADNVILRKTQNHRLYESILKQLVKRLNGCPM